MRQFSRESLLYGWAQTLLFFGASQQALPVLQEVVALNPKRHDAWNVLGYLHAQKGELSHAIAAFDGPSRASRTTRRSRSTRRSPCSVQASTRAP
jgi:predicted Zn-dependent protease